jgi:hypothetical protein
VKAKPKASESVNETADDPGSEPGSVYVSAEDVEAFEEWQRIRAEFGGDEGKVVLKRRNSKGNIATLDVLGVADFSIERVMQDWGGGRYIATAFKGQTKMGQIQFEIDESVPKRTPIREVQPQIQISQSVPTMEDPRIAAMERMIQSNNDLMKTLLTAMVQKGNGSDGALEIGLKIADMVQARAPAQPEKPSFDMLKEVFLAGLDAKHAAEGTNEEGYMPVVRAFAEPISKVLNAALTRDRNVAAGSIPVPVRAPAQPAAPPPPALPPGQAWLIHLQPHLDTILSWAKAGKDPELYAEVILDNIEPGAQMEIGEAAKDPEFVSKTLAALPMFIPYSAWATATLTNIKEILTAPPEPEETGAGGEQ